MTPIPGQVTEPRAGAKPGDQGGLAMAAIRALRWITQPAIARSPQPAPQSAQRSSENTIWVVGGSSGGTGYRIHRLSRNVVNTNYGQPGAGVISWDDFHATAIGQPCRYIAVQ
jgi:hypothetical protein